MANNTNSLFLIWGRDPLAKQHLNKAAEMKNLIKSETVKTYTTSNAVITISKSGQIHKSGKLNFEKKKMKNDHNKPELILLKSMGSTVNYQASKISLGDNHILVLTKNNMLFSWGDNYYGQLGLNNYLIPLINSPQLVKIHYVEKIKAFRNNSFAIDGKISIKYIISNFFSL
jgi:hypothetical protein